MNAVELVAEVLGGVPAPDLRCEWAECARPGERHRNGVWCEKHAVRMERWLTSCVVCGRPAEWRQYGCCYLCAREVWRVSAEDDDRG